MLIAILVILLIVVVLLAAFAIQNTAVITVTFLGWVMTGVPIWGVVTAAAALAAIVVILAIVPFRIRRGFQERSTHQVIAERDKKIGEISGNLGSLQADRDQLALRLDQATSERDQLADHLKLATTERDQLLQQVQALRAERDRLAASTAALGADTQSVASDIPDAGTPLSPTEETSAPVDMEQSQPEDQLPPEKRSWWDPRT